MERPQRDVRIRVDAYTRVCLTAIAALLTLTVIGLWSDRAPSGPDARAGVVSLKGGNPDTSSGSGEGNKPNYEVSSTAGLRDEAQKTNAKLQDLLTLLKSGEVKVQVMKPEKADRPETSEPAEKPEKAPKADQGDTPEKTEGTKDGSE